MLFAPFRGSFFDPSTVEDIAAATCPPYDVITEADARRYRTASRHNMVRLLLAGPHDPNYTEAAGLLNTWREDGSLYTEDQPRFYAYQMRYTAPDGSSRVAGGIIGALALLPLGEKVLPHEETMPKTKADRLSVLTATQANLDLIIGLTPAPDFRSLMEPSGPPRLDLHVEGVNHRLYAIEDRETIAAISAAVEAHPVAIADGHHRFTTGLRHRGIQNRPGPWDAIMAFLVPADGSGLTIGPTHRVFPRINLDESLLETRFTIGACDPLPPKDPGSVVLVPGSGHSAGPLGLTPHPDVFERLPRPWRLAGPAVARELLYGLLDTSEDQASYYADPSEALAAGDRFSDGAVVLMAAVPEHAISEATQAGLRFPQKSTFYVPKPRSGLVIRCFADQETTG
jgi:uncharacterized protein (DUF1015 family)